MCDPVTSDLAEFGFAELREAARLLTAYCDNPSSLSLGSDVRVCLNRDSGFVFLSDENYSAAMMNGDKLVMATFSLLASKRDSLGWRYRTG